MRILEVVQGLGRGGAERALLQRIGHAPPDVETLIVNLRPRIDALDPPPGTPMLKLGDVSGSERKTLLYAIDNFQPDVIVVRTPHDVLLATRLLKLHKRPLLLIAEAHLEVSTYNRAMQRPLNQLLRRANRHIHLHLAVSERVASGIQCAGGRQVHVHHLGAEVETNAEPALPPIRGSRFLVLGRLHPAKRPLFVVEVAKGLSEQLRKTESEVVFVGDGPEEAKLREYVANADLADIVKVVGAVDNPSPYLASADILASASLVEGLPLTFFEAKQMGLRILTTPAGGAHEILRSPDVITTGFGVEEFRHAMAEIIADGKPDGSQKHRVARSHADFSSTNRAKIYYEIVRQELSCRRVVEFYVGPIEGGIPATMRSRLAHQPPNYRTVIVSPNTRTAEAKASPESFPVSITVCAPRIRGLRQMIEVVRTQRPDIIIAHTERDQIWASVARKLAGSGSPIVRMVHSDQRAVRWFTRPIVTWLLARSSRSTDLAVAASSGALSGESGVLVGAQEVLHQPADLTDLPHPAVIPDKPRFIAAGRLIPAKGFDRLIQGVGGSATALRDRGAHVTIAGAGPEFQRLNDMVEALRVQDLISIRGHVPQVATVMANAHYFLQPSLTEGAGMALLEAMAVGCRCASGPVGLAPDLLDQDAECTLFLDVPTANDWRDWLATAAGSPLPDIAERRQRAATTRATYDVASASAAFYQRIDMLVEVGS